MSHNLPQMPRLYGPYETLSESERLYFADQLYVALTARVNEVLKYADHKYYGYSNGRGETNCAALLNGDHACTCKWTELRNDLFREGFVP